MEKYLEDEFRIYNLLDKIALAREKGFSLTEEIFSLKVGPKNYQVQFLEEQKENNNTYSFILKNKSKTIEIKRKSKINTNTCEIDYSIKSNTSPDNRKIKVSFDKDKKEEAIFYEETQESKTIEKTYDFKTGKIKKVFSNPYTYLLSNEKIVFPLVEETFAFKDNDIYLLQKEALSFTDIIKKLDEKSRELLTLKSKLEELNIDASKETSSLLEKITSRKAYLENIKKHLLYVKTKLFKFPPKLSFISLKELEQIATSLEEKITFSKQKDNLFTKTLKK